MFPSLLSEINFKTTSIATCLPIDNNRNFSRSDDIDHLFAFLRVALKVTGTKF